MNIATDSAPLLARTQHLVKSAPRHVTYTMMASAIGVSVAWISRFADDKIPDPGVRRVQALHDYLASGPGELGKAIKYEEWKDWKPKRRACVYLIFEGDVCLYIGCTVDFVIRMRGHEQTRKFDGHSPTHIKFVWYDDETTTCSHAVRKCERSLIKQHKPLFNKYK